MAKVPQGVEILPKISIAWVGCTNVTDDRQTDRRTADDIKIIANMNLSSRSLKKFAISERKTQEMLNKLTDTMQSKLQAAY